MNGGGTLVKALSYKPEGRVFDYSLATRIPQEIKTTGAKD
jgi:hypothetical protein